LKTAMHSSVMDNVRSSGRESGRLRLKLLGSCDASVDGRPAGFRTRKTLALLAYLALDPRPHRRETIAELLWPRDDRADARVNLRTALAYVRVVLGATAEAILVTNRDTVGVAPGSLDLDIDALRELRQVIHRPPDLHIRPQLAHAISNYRGPFLTGLVFHDAPELEEWIEVQRVYWRNVASELLCLLATLQQAAGEVAPAMQTLERWTEVSPDEEPAWRRLIEAHLDVKDHLAARHAWDRYVIAINQLNLTPTEAMSRLYERIRGPVVIQPPRGERSPESARLWFAYQRIQSGGTEAVIGDGADEAEKTRLISAFLASIRQDGSDLIAGKGFDGMHELPYAAIIDGLRPRLEAENAPDDLLADTWLAELARLLPELVERYPDLSVSPEDCFTRGRLFEAVCRLGMALAQRRPLVILVDNAQSVDADSRDVLRYAMRRWSALETRILLVVVARGIGADRGFEQWLDALDAENITSRIRIGGDGWRRGEASVAGSPLRVLVGRVE
jgi:DNA-binding SARP family transcriptional activator